MKKDAAGNGISVREGALESLLEIMEENLFCDKVIHQTLEKNDWEIRSSDLKDKGKKDETGHPESFTDVGISDIIYGEDTGFCCMQ